MKVGKMCSSIKVHILGAAEVNYDAFKMPKLTAKHIRAAQCTIRMKGHTICTTCSQI